MVKRLFYTVIVCLGILGCVVIHSVPEALSAEITTLPMHSPIYPDATTNVTYTLNVEADDGVKEIKLEELVYTVDDEDGNMTAAPSSALLNTWTFSAPEPYGTQTTFSTTGGYGTDKYIEYKYTVTDTNNLVKTHVVGFAIDPYMPSTFPPQDVDKQPAPVYAQVDVAQAMDIVFIPDYSDFGTDKAGFHLQCEKMINDGLYFDITSDNMTKPLWQFFNFFINPTQVPGASANTNPMSHDTPDNWSNLTFAQGQAIIHKDSTIDDHADSTLFSLLQDNVGTMVHEAGHALFGLMDEYGPTGLHIQSGFLPNNWSKKGDARAEASSRHKVPKDTKKIHQLQKFKLCDKEGQANECQMNNAGTTCIKYDKPCRDRMEYKIKSNAGIPYP